MHTVKINLIANQDISVFEQEISIYDIISIQIEDGKIIGICVRNLDSPCGRSDLGRWIEKPVPEWSSEWPVTEGRYWFYGKRFKDSLRKNELFTVIVRKHGSGTKANSFAYVCDGAFLYPAEGAEGFWLPLPEPKLPE